MQLIKKQSSPAMHSNRDTGRMMMQTSLLLVGLAAYSVIYSYYAISQKAGEYALYIYLVSVITSIVIELLACLINKKSPLDKFFLSQILITPLIYSLTLTLDTSLVIAALGSALATIVKIAFGGFARQKVNSAMVGRVLVWILTTGSILPEFMTKTGFEDVMKSAFTIDTYYSGAYRLTDVFLGTIPGPLGTTCIPILIVVGSLLLLFRIIDLRITLSAVISMIIMSAIFGAYQVSDPVVFSLMNVFVGGYLYASLMVITDPVTSPTSPLGKILYGIFFAFAVMFIREQGYLTEGMVLAVLFVNILTPIIDRFILYRTDRKKALQVFIILLTVGLLSAALIYMV